MGRRSEALGRIFDKYAGPFLDEAEELYTTYGKRFEEALDTVREVLGVDAEPEQVVAATRRALQSAPEAASGGRGKSTARGGSPAAAVSQEYGRDVARRTREYVEPDAPLSEWRDVASRFAVAEPPNAYVETPRPFSVRPAEVAFDPRIEPRKGEQQVIQDLTVRFQPRAMDPIEEVSIFDLEGRPFITSVSDLTAAGRDIVGINDVTLRRPFSLRGGQDYMFDNPGAVWAADKGRANRHVELARRLRDMTGEEPLFFPWMMGPNASYFSHMPRGAQYAYADAAIEGADRRALEGRLREILPDWRSFDDPESADLFMRAAGAQRGALNTMLDKEFRNRGGLGRGAANYATIDYDQVGAPIMQLRNVGVIDPTFDAAPSSHASYGFDIPGRGLGRLREQGIGALALRPELMRELGYSSPFDYPVGAVSGVANPRRSWELGATPGIITEDTLRLIERLQDEGLVGR